ncbi:uncharacterized protein LOC129218999 [Uloborus diversus]|uniref:uncharacterized protein LOC129218999 n=1 Tax=Uloborus diversus TaxID=327109 RepID=UPI0024096B1F|nr:uncharacterized protein LOC129218999 [Uloborus diversus]
MFTTWTYKHAGHSVVERGNRIRPERHNRKNIQKMTWRSNDWVKGFREEVESRVESMTIADVSPGVAIRRVLLLYENQQYREAANFINRLNYSTFKVILGELPVELFVDNIPHTLAILEALYARVFLADGLEISLKLLRPDSVVMQMVKVFALQQEDSSPVNSFTLDPKHPVVASCKKLLKVIVLSEPRMKKLITTRKRALDKSIKGLGQHGMVGTSENTLMNLHEALKLEFERVIHRYKSAVQKLDELSLAPKQPITRSISHGPAPIKASHQRQLSLRQEEIQERLIKNKTLLNVIEPTLNNQSMNTLLSILQKRIETDKDAMFQFTQLRKEVKDMSPNAIVASVLMRFSQGCQNVLELIKDFSDDDNDDSSTDLSGYHSDSDSAIALSGSSPTGSTTNRTYKYNLLYRSVRFGDRNRSTRSSGSSDNQSLTGGTSLSSLKSIIKSHPEMTNGSRGCFQTKIPQVEPRGLCKFSESPTPSLQLSSSSHSSTVSHDSWQVASLRREVEMLKSELTQSRRSIECLQERERKMKERLSEQARLMLDRGMRFENVALGERRPTALIRRYGNLYAQSRVDTLDALDSIAELEHAHDLKSKILFSAIVLSFRSVYNTICEIRSRVRHILQICEERERMDPTLRDLDFCISTYLKNSVDKFDLRKNLDEVLSQIWATLYDYPSLKKCEGLKHYIKDCVRLAWSLSNQYPPFVIEYDARTFRRDLHVRFHSSNQESEHIKTYLWPTLLEGKNGPCVHKGVVVT